MTRPSQVVRAADLSPKTCLESEAEVEAYLASLKARLLAVPQAVFSNSGMSLERPEIGDAKRVDLL